MLSGAPPACAPASLPLGGTPDILDLQNLLMATSLLLGHQALPVAPEHMPAGLQALPWPCFAPRMTDLHPGVPRAFQGPSEGVGGSQHQRTMVCRGAGAQTAQGLGGGWHAMPRGDGLSLLSCDGQEMALGANMEGLASTPQTRAPTRGCSQKVTGLLLKSNLQLALSQSSHQALAQSCGSFFFLIKHKVCGFSSSPARQSYMQ